MSCWHLAASPDVRLVTLTGPGGSGKTRLATAVAAALGPSYRDGAYFVPLAAVTSGDAMWASVAEVLGAAGEDRARPQFLQWVRDLQALLVLDNLEQLPGSPTVVGELLDAAQALDIVTTSRRPLHLHGEQEYPVPPLALPKGDGVDEAQRSEAVLLFCQHAALARRGFALTADNEADVVALCQRLDGMPLAIELAAARVKLLSPSALLARMDDTSDLAGRQVDRPERQQTLRAAIGWSYDLLPAELQGVFRRLGVFAGGADLDAVGAVAATGRGRPRCGCRAGRRLVGRRWPTTLTASLGSGCCRPFATSRWNGSPRPARVTRRESGTPATTPRWSSDWPTR